MNDIVPQSLGALPAVFKGAGATDDMASGVTAGFGVMSFRGKAWRLKHRGEETVLMRPDGDGPRASIEVVIVRAAPVISKIFYEVGYTEGSTAPPDCWSTNGVAPDPAAPKKQSATCAGCPHNAWGSKVTTTGKAGKSCSDSKRLAVVPLEDIDNEAFGGPLLLRIPAASLSDMAGYSQKMTAMGYPYFSVGTRLSFDVAAEYPKIDFGAIRVLTEPEAIKVAALQSDPRVSRILDEAVEMASHMPESGAADVSASPFEQPPAAAAPAAAPATTPPATAAPVAAETAPAPVAESAPVAPATPAATTASAPTAAPAASAAPSADSSSPTPEEMMAKAQAAFGNSPDPAPAAAAPVAATPAPVAAAPAPAPVAEAEPVVTQAQQVAAAQATIAAATTAAAPVAEAAPAPAAAAPAAPVTPEVTGEAVDPATGEVSPGNFDAMLDGLLTTPTT